MEKEKRRSSIEKLYDKDGKFLGLGHVHLSEEGQKEWEAEALARRTKEKRTITT